MNWVANRSDEDFRFEFVIVEDRDDGLDQLHTALADVIQTAYKGTYKVSTRFGGHNRLRRRKDESHIHTHALFAENLRRLEAFFCHWTLHHNVLVKLRKMPALIDHTVRV